VITAQPRRCRRTFRSSPSRSPQLPASAVDMLPRIRGKPPRTAARSNRNTIRQGRDQPGPGCDSLRRSRPRRDRQADRGQPATGWCSSALENSPEYPQLLGRTCLVVRVGACRGLSNSLRRCRLRKQLGGIPVVLANSTTTSISTARDNFFVHIHGEKILPSRTAIAPFADDAEIRALG